MVVLCPGFGKGKRYVDETTEEKDSSEEVGPRVDGLVMTHE